MSMAEAGVDAPRAVEITSREVTLPKSFKGTIATFSEPFTGEHIGRQRFAQFRLEGCVVVVDILHDVSGESDESLFVIRVGGR